MKKSRALAVTSFIFGLLFWVPLLNFIFGALSVLLGIIALKKIKSEPANYGGKWFAIAGILLGALVYITFSIGLGMCLSGFKDICKNIGLSFLAKS